MLLTRNSVRSRPQHWLSVLAFLVVESFDDLVEEIVGRRHAFVATLAGSLFLFIAFLQHRRTTSWSPSGHWESRHDFGARCGCLFERSDCRNPSQWAVGLHQALLSTESIADAAARDFRIVSYVGTGRSFVRKHHVGAFGGRILVALAGFLVPTPIMALDLLIGLLQAYIFAILSTVYIGAAIQCRSDE